MSPATTLPIQGILGSLRLGDIVFFEEDSTYLGGDADEHGHEIDSSDESEEDPVHLDGDVYEQNHEIDSSDDEYMGIAAMHEQLEN